MTIENRVYTGLAINIVSLGVIAYFSGDPMKEIDQAFYDLVVLQRDSAWREAEQLARDVLSMAEDGGMPDSYFETDSRIVRARATLAKSPQGC
jgi:hypothetical protein